MLKHFIKYLAGDIAVKVLGFLSLPLYTFFLVPEKYGIYSLIISYVTIAVVVLPLNVHASVSRFFYDDTLDIKMFMGTTLSLTLVTLSVSLIAINFADTSVLSEMLGFDFQTFGTLALLIVVLRIIFDIYKQTLIPQKKSKEFSLLMVTKTYLTFLLIIGSFLVTEPNPINMLYGVIIAESLVCLYILRKMRIYLPFNFDISSCKYILNYSVFLMPYVLSSVLMSQIDTIMLANIFSTYEVGIYNVAYVLSMVPLMLFTSFSNAWTPSYFKFMDNQQYSLLKRDVVRILGVVSILVFLVSLFSQEIIWVLVDEKYKESASVLPLLTLSVFFMVLWQMWGRGISYKRKTIWTSGIGIVSALLNISLNYYLIPIYSMKGAVYATLISFIFMSFSGYFVSKYLLKIYTVNIYSLKYIFAFNIFTLCITFIESAVILYTLKGIVIIAISIGVFHFRKSIVKIVKDRSG